MYILSNTKRAAAMVAATGLVLALPVVASTGKPVAPAALSQGTDSGGSVGQSKAGQNDTRAASTSDAGQDKTTPASGTERAAVNLQNVVVTAQRRSQPVQDVPMTVDVISPHRMKESGVTSIFTLDHAVSGLSYGGAGNSSQPSIRGVSATVSVGGAENDVALYVDGVFYSQPQLFGMNLPDVQRVEVLKGPVGALFGRNSVAGAVRIFTRDPTFTPTGDFSVNYGWYTGDQGSRAAPHTTVNAFVSAPLVDNLLAFSVAGSYDYTPGWMTDVATGDRSQPVKHGYGRIKLLATPTDNLRMVLNAYSLRADQRGQQAMTPLDGLTVASAYPGSIVPRRPYHTGFAVTPHVGNWDNADIKSHGVSLNVKWTTNLGVLTSISSRNMSEAYNRTTIAQANGSLQCRQLFACLYLDFGTSTDATSQEFNFTSKQWDHFSFIAGLYYYINHGTHLVYINGDMFPTMPRGLLSVNARYNLYSTAGYGQLSFKATDRMTLSVGGRYTKERRRDELLGPTQLKRGQDFHSFLPQASLMYKLTPTTNAYVTFSEGWASGLTGIENSGSEPPYQPVKPEKNIAWEVGLKYANSNAAFNLAAFYYNFLNKQEQVASLSATGGGGEFNVFHMNTGPVRVYGLDFNANVRLNHWSVGGGLTWVPVSKYLDFPLAAGITTDRNPNGTFQSVIFDATGWRLMRSPKLSANFTLGYNQPMGKGYFDASAVLNYTSEVYQDAYHILRQGGYTTLGAQVGYTFENYMRIGLYGRNLTARTYMFQGFSSTDGFTINYGPPREVGVTVSYSF